MALVFLFSYTMAKLIGQKKATPAKKAAAKETTTKATSKRGKKAEPSIRQIDPDTENERVMQLNGQDVSFTNLQKVYWPKEGFRKGDMVNYYLQMAPFILPYLVDRPHSLNRHPNGIAAPHFFQKDMRGKVPHWIETFAEFSESTGKTVHYLVCKDEATLLYMVNLGCIEINPWHARKQDYQRPDWCLIDLDPDKGNTFDEVVDVATMVKKVLDSIGAMSCVKTSGSTGIHIYIPLGAGYSFGQSKQLAEGVVTVVQKEMPGLTSMERTPAKRKGKIYLDFLQNKETQTAAAPYSLRPKPGVPVSTPLHWDEVKRGLTPTTWTAHNVYERVKSEGDLFQPVLGKGIDLNSVLKTLETFI